MAGGVEEKAPSATRERHWGLIEAQANAALPRVLFGGGHFAMRGGATATGSGSTATSGQSTAMRGNGPTMGSHGATMRGSGPTASSHGTTMRGGSPAMCGQGAAMGGGGRMAHGHLFMSHGFMAHHFFVRLNPRRAGEGRQQEQAQQSGERIQQQPFGHNLSFSFSSFFLFDFCQAIPSPQG